MKTFWLALPILSICTARLFAQLEDPGQVIKSHCAKYERTPLPAEALDAAVPKHWPNCNSYKAYGADGKMSFEAARQCAWAERLASQKGLEPYYAKGRLFAGSAILTLLYANGDGVEKNIPLAIRFACESGWAPGEVEGHVKNIEAATKDSISKDHTFRFCEDPSSDFMESFCENYDAELADQARADALKHLSSEWPELQQTAFAMLEETQLAYSAAHGKGEVTTAGASRSSLQIRAEASVRDSFLAAIRAYERGEIPHYSAEDAKQSEAELEQAFNKALAESLGAEDGTLKPDDLRAAEVAWRKYRDAWIIFARFRYPLVSPETWVALLTRDRIATLRGGPCEADPDDSGCKLRDTDDPRPLP
jgi:Lysozyme inhibitor LprI